MKKLAPTPKVITLTATLLAMAMSLAAAQVPQRTMTTHRVGSEQIERVIARVTTTMAIVNRLGAEAKQRGLADGWRRATLESLLPLPLATLLEIEQRASSLDALEAALSEIGGTPPTHTPREGLDDPNVLGSPDRDLVYTPITPCRFIDTRNAVGKINGFRNYTLADSGAAYGGNPSCHLPALLGAIPNSFGALAMNVTVVDTSAAGAPGFLAVNPVALSQTTSLLNWYEAGVDVQVANLGIATIDQEPTHPFEFAIQTSGPVHVVVDIFGAFLAPRSTAIETFNATNANVPIGPSQTVSALSPPCPAGFTVTGGSCLSAPQDFLVLQTSAHVGVAWACVYINGPGATKAFTVQVTCGRVPGR